MRILKNYFLLPTLFIAFATTCLTSCDNNDSPGSTTPLTVEDVKGKIIGQWESDEMTLTFTPNNIVNIKHDEIYCESPYESVYVAPRDDNEPFTIRQGEKRVEVLVGYEDDYYGYEYMYIRTINNRTLTIEFYGKGITFKLKKTGDITTCSSCNGDGEQTCHACDGAGGKSIIYYCYYCNGSGEQECHACAGSGILIHWDPDTDIWSNTTCYSCYGSGRETCNSCWGSGRFGSDWDNCDYCRGTGTKGNCYDCNGDGYNITPIK